MSDARRRQNARIRRAHYAREHGVVREATEDRFKFSSKDTGHIKQAADHLLTLMKHGNVTRQHIEAEQQADKHRLIGMTAVAGPQNEDETRKINAIRYRMAVRDKALDAFAGMELQALDSSTSRSGRVVTSSPPWKPWRTTESNSASSYAYLQRRGRRRKKGVSRGLR